MGNDTASDEVAQQQQAEAVKPLAEQEASDGVRALCLFVIFLSRLEVSVLTLVIPHIAVEFGCSLEFAAWVNFLPSFAGTMFSPSVGKFSDMYGHARTWQASVLLLAFSTWLAAWSPSFPLLLLARGLTGFAGNGIMNPSLPLMAKGLDKDRRGSVQSHISSVDALGSSMGVLFGGFLIDRVSWRAIFLIPAPLLTLMWIVSRWVLGTKSRAVPGVKEPGRGCLPAFDWLGTLLFASMSFCLLFSINRGNDEGWGSPMVLGLMFTAILLAPALAVTEARAKHPVLPIWLFGTPARTLLTVTSAMTWSCYGSCFLLVPVYMQDALGMSAGLIGNLLTVRPIAGSLLAALMSSLISRKAFRMRSTARIGAVTQLLSYSLLNVVGRLKEGKLFYTLLELQLITQAVGAFSTGLPGNAMFVATLAEDQLANVTAMRGVIIGFASLCVQTSNLSLISAIGSEFDPKSYRPTWFILSCLQLVVVASTILVPASAELGYAADVQPDVTADTEKGHPAKAPEVHTEREEERQEDVQEDQQEEDEEDDAFDEEAEGQLRVDTGKHKRKRRAAAKAAVKIGGKAVSGLKAVGAKAAGSVTRKDSFEQLPLSVRG